MTVLIVQVRLDSVRLPGKALLPVMGKPAVQHVLETLSLIQADKYVLATTADSEPYLRDISEICGFHLVTGSKENVYDRFCKAAGIFNPDIIIRATGDNTVLGHNLIQNQFEEVNSGRYDYAGYKGIPVGTGVEIFNYKSLVKCGETIMTDYDREHVTPCIYNNPDVFRVNWMKPEAFFYRPDLSFTLDTRKDYRNLNTLFRSLYKGSPLKLKQALLWTGLHDKEAV